MKAASTPNKRMFIMMIAFSICFPGSAFWLEGRSGGSYCAGGTAGNRRLSKSYAQLNRKGQFDETQSRQGGSARPKRTKKTRGSFVKLVDFYLKDGTFVSGKLLTDDTKKMVIEKLEDSTIVVATYTKREIDPRTVKIKSMPEYKYHLELAAYFSGRTWDFRDDPDEFIQAIRCYEKAKQTMPERQKQTGEKTEQINQKIDHLRSDREVWARETESRAKLKKLELEATIETRMKKLEKKVNAGVQAIDESLEILDKIVMDIKYKNQELKKSISDMEEEISRRLDIFEDRIEDNRALINRLNYYRRIVSW